MASRIDTIRIAMFPLLDTERTGLYCFQCFHNLQVYYYADFEVQMLCGSVPQTEITVYLCEMHKQSSLHMGGKELWDITVQTINNSLNSKD